MKKIGLLTLSASDNCGSLLQCYALKEILSSFGCVEVINFSTKKSHELYDLPKLKLTYILKLIFRNKKRKAYFRFLKSKIAYQYFREKFLSIKHPEIFPEEIQNIKDKYDVVVVGSDQVWNVCMVDFDDSFFCGWTDKRKVAYAPSLGGHDIRESNNYEKIVKILNDFDYVSVRESSGKNCLENILEKTIPQLLDPTLLLSENKWQNLIEITPPPISKITY